LDGGAEKLQQHLFLRGAPAGFKSIAGSVGLSIGRKRVFVQPLISIFCLKAIDAADRSSLN